MAENTAIEWATHTFNPWMGCTKVSPACAHCYAERDMDKRLGKVKWGPQGTRVMTSADYWRKPLKWNAEAAATGVRPRVFCASLADVFEDWGGPITASGKNPVYLSNDGRASDGSNRMTMDDVRAELFALIDATPHLDWLLLTKRPENIRRMLVRHSLDRVAGHVSQNAGDGYHLRQRPNVWLGVSAENQEQADRRIPELLGCRDLAPVLFLSCEPLLGSLNLQRSCTIACGNKGKCQHDADTGHRIIRDSTEGGMFVECICSRLNGIDWVIAGGESGPLARPSHPDWFRWLREQCQAAGVPFLFKQWGEWLADPRMFQSLTHWETKAPTWVGRGDWCLDMAGIHCDRGGRFETAQFPVAIMSRIGKKNAGRLLDGAVHNDFPRSGIGIPASGSPAA